MNFLPEENTSGYYCFRCQKDIPNFGFSREEMNSKTKTYWLINFCPRCGTVTSVDKYPFLYSNLLPRIGKVKSFLFVLLLGTPFYAISWSVGGLAPGLGVSIFILLLAILVSSGTVHEVEDCKYKRWGQYADLKKEK